MAHQTSVQNTPVGRHDERGASLSALVAPVMLAIFLVAGLVVDGGAQTQAHRRAQVVAAHAVRSGSDASAAGRLVGADGTAPALATARAVLADEGIDGQVTMESGVLTVTTNTWSETTFLGLLGVHRLEAHGRASAELRAV